MANTAPQPSAPKANPTPPASDKHMPETPASPPPNFDPPKDFKLPKPGEKDWVQGAPESDDELHKTEEAEKKKLAEGKKVYEARDKALGVKDSAHRG